MVAEETAAALFEETYIGGRFKTDARCSTPGVYSYVDGLEGCCRTKLAAVMLLRSSSFSRGRQIPEVFLVALAGGVVLNERAHAS